MASRLVREWSPLGKEGSVKAGIGLIQGESLMPGARLALRLCFLSRCVNANRGLMDRPTKFLEGTLGPWSSSCGNEK